MNERVPPAEADQEIGEFDAEVGRKLRRFRRAADKTIQQVADETGLSVSFISQIERGRSTPSLASFCRLCRALGASTDTLLGLADQTQPVTRKGERTAFSLGDKDRFYEKLGPGFPGAIINACLVYRPPGHASELFSHEGEEFVYLLDGEITYQLDGTKYFLHPGDTLHFQSMRQHISTVGDKPAVELWVGTMPLYDGG